MTQESAPTRVPVTQGEHESKKVELTIAPGSDWKLMKIHFEHTAALRTRSPWSIGREAA